MTLSKGGNEASGAFQESNPGNALLKGKYEILEIWIICVSTKLFKHLFINIRTSGLVGE